MKLNRIPSDFPVFRCRESGFGSEATWHFWCPYCRKEHTHGAGAGHRVAHCPRPTPLTATGYYLVGASAAEVANDAGVTSPEAHFREGYWHGYVTALEDVDARTRKRDEPVAVTIDPALSQLGQFAMGDLAHWYHGDTSQQVPPPEPKPLSIHPATSPTRPRSLARA